MHVELSRHDRELGVYAQTIERFLRKQHSDMSEYIFLHCDALTTEIVLEVVDEL